MCYTWVNQRRTYEAFLLGGGSVSGITYLVFSDDVECDDGRIFSRSYGFLLTVNFITQNTSFQDELIRSGLVLDNLVDFYEISCEDKNHSMKAVTIINKAEYFVFAKDLESFLEEINFRFADGSVLIILKNNLIHRL